MPSGGFYPAAFAAVTDARKQDGVYGIEDGKLVLRWARRGKDTLHDFERAGESLKIGGLAASECAVLSADGGRR
jgi:hypothetical protein